MNTEVKGRLTNYHCQNSIPQNSCYKVAHIPFQPSETTPGAKTNLHRERDRIRRLYVPYSVVSISKKERGGVGGDIHMLSLRCLPTLPKRSQSLSTFHRITPFILLDLPHQHHPLRTLPPLSSKFVWGPWDAGFPAGEGLSFGGVREGREEVGCSLSGGAVPSS